MSSRLLLLRWGRSRGCRERRRRRAGNGSCGGGHGKPQAVQAQAQAAAVQATLNKLSRLPGGRGRQKRATAYFEAYSGCSSRSTLLRRTVWKKQLPAGVASADVSAARHRIAAQEAAVRNAEAAVEAAESGVSQAEAGVTGQLAALGRAEAQFAATKSAPKQVAQSRSQTDAAEADAARAQAEVNQAKLNLSYTKIYAPISGHIARKSLEQGDFVQIGEPLLALVDPDLWVVANFKEHN